MPSDCETRAAELIGAGYVSLLHDAGLTIVDAERLTKLEDLADASREWLIQGGIDRGQRMRQAAKAMRHISGDH